MMTRIIFTLTILFISAGCTATPGSLTRDSPDMVLTSKKTPKVVAECIASKWENIQVLFGIGGTVNMRTVKDGYRLVLYIDTSLGYVADVEATLSGSKTTLWKRVVSFGATTQQMSDVSGCQ